PRRPSDLSRFIVAAFMGSLVTSLKDLLGDDTASRRGEFAGDPPVGSVDYAELASVPVRFKQSNNAVIFDASVLDLELSNASSVMASVCERHCEGLLRTLNWNHGLAGQVRERLLHSMADFPSVAEMARSLSMSERTLRRRLRAEDTGYQEILNEVRGHLAKEYLTTTELPVADIAILLGFDESANFRRAFKQWTGQPPGAYRKSELRPN
ncbi:MAG: helix-turn-helix domain-containing protein, partial [Pseudomonadota bacterium]